MFAVLVIFALIWFVFLASTKIIIATFVIGFAVSATVKYATKFITHTTPSHFQAIKAVALSFVLVALALFTQFSFTSGAGSFSVFIAASSAPVIALGPFIAYILGFRIVLGIGVIQSVVVSVIALTVSVLTVMCLKSLSVL